MNEQAERYVKLVLALGEHDPDFVDAYYGPPGWREDVRTTRPSLPFVHAAAIVLRDELLALGTPPDPLEALRLGYLRRQTESLIVRAEILLGRTMRFDEESQALYDAVAPHHPESHFQKLNDAIANALPGTGPLSPRLELFRSRFVIPKERLDAVFRKAIDICRTRTLERIALPPEEAFRVELVTNRSWSGYNWYEGGFRSLIQVNTDLPVFMDRALDLACHEGYPGHHVYNVLLEKNLAIDRGWVETRVYALFSPQSLIAEGSANYGIEVAFSREERLGLVQEVLFPLAGLDPALAEDYARVNDLVAQTGYAGNEAARRYLDGDMRAAEAEEWLVTYGLMSPERAAQRLKFIEQYRSYVINYNLGKDLVAAYIERRAGSDPDLRWSVFADLLSSPRLPSGLA